MHGDEGQRKKLCAKGSRRQMYADGHGKQNTAEETVMRGVRAVAMSPEKPLDRKRK